MHIFRKWNIDDEVWIHLGNHKGERIKGKIVAFLDLQNYRYRNYIIEINTSVDPLLEVRNDFCMWISQVDNLSDEDINDEANIDDQI